VDQVFCGYVRQERPKKNRKRKEAYFAAPMDHTIKISVYIAFFLTIFGV